MNRAKLIYATDALCGWCFATGPALEAMLEQFGDLIELEVITYGLCAGDRVVVMRPEFVEEFRCEAESITRKTGVEFGEGLYRFLEAPGCRLDSQPAAEALIAVRELAPVAAFGFIHRVQQDLFVDGVDPGDRAALRELAIARGVDASGYDARVESAGIVAAAEADYARVQALGIKQVPTLLLEAADGGTTQVFTGYIDATSLTGRVADALAGAMSGEGAQGPACGPDGCD